MGMFCLNIAKLVRRRNSWSITGETNGKLTSICELDLFILHKWKFLKLTIKKILPGSKSYNSQQEVKRCFGIRWYVFRWQDLLEVCRIQTSSAGKEHKDIKWKLATFVFRLLHFCVHSRSTSFNAPFPSFLERVPFTYLLRNFWLNVVLWMSKCLCRLLKHRDQSGQAWLTDSYIFLGV